MFKCVLCSLILFLVLQAMCSTLIKFAWRKFTYEQMDLSSIQISRTQDKYKRGHEELIKERIAGYRLNRNVFNIVKIDEGLKLTNSDTERSSRVNNFPCRVIRIPSNND